MSNPSYRVALTGNIFANQKFGGVSRYILELARGLASLDEWTPFIDSPFFTNGYLRELSRGERKQIGLPMSSLYLPGRPRGLNAISRPLSKLLNSAHQRPDIVHEMFYEDRNLSKSKSAKVSTFYDMIHERFIHGDPILAKKKAAARLSDRCIAISETTKRDMIHYLAIDPDRVDVIHLASSMRAEPRRIGMATRDNYLLWVGPRAGYKNFDNFAMAFGRSRAYRDGCFVICAGGPTFSTTEREQLGRSGVDPIHVVHVLPDEIELASLYTHARLLCYASMYEGFGIPPLEAMNCRCPVIASNAGSIPEVVGDAGRLFDPTCTEAITDAIDAVIESSSEAKRLADAGVNRASRFSWSRCVQETTRVYKGLVA